MLSHANDAPTTIIPGIDAALGAQSTVPVPSWAGETGVADDEVDDALPLSLPLPLPLLDDDGVPTLAPTPPLLITFVPLPT